MDAFRQYKFPVKVKKFNITKPSLMLFVAKYENQIPWERGIINENQLENYISSVLLPKLFEATSLPTSDYLKKTYFVGPAHISLNENINDYVSFQKDEVEKAKELSNQYDETAGKRYLAEIINARKNKSFGLWKAIMKKQYKHDPAFSYMLLCAVFATTPFGSRRELDVPDKDVIAWIYLQINHKKFRPHESLSKNYFLKKSFGKGLKIINGWQHIPRGTANSSKLSASARGSGWCIADRNMSNHYLEDFSFYVLRKSGKPVVALRVNQGTIHECVGIHNSDPVDFYYDIKLYTDYMKMNFKNPDLYNILKNLSFDNFSMEWWQQRITLWPGSYFKAKENIGNNIEIPTLENFVPYFDYLSIDQLIKDFNLTVNPEFLSKALSMDPLLYDKIKHYDEKQTEKNKAICILAWLEKIEAGELTISEYKDIPVFVKDSKGYNQLVEKQFGTKLYKELYKIPKTFKAKRNQLNAEDLLAYDHDESLNTTIKRVTLHIIRNETSDFSDDIFPNYLRSRDDFKDIRFFAWQEAVSDQPTFRMALPPDLIHLPEFAFDQSIIAPDQIQKAVDIILQKPWKINEKVGILGKTRHREEILLAYIKGWQPFIKKNPERLWCITNRAYGRREYISYAALRNRQIIDTYFTSFRDVLNKNRDIWPKLSERTQNIPVIKFAFLMALHNCKSDKLKKKYLGSTSPLKENLSSDSVSVLNRKILSIGAAYFFHKFKTNQLGSGLEFTDFPIS